MGKGLLGVVVAHREGYALLAECHNDAEPGSSHFRYSTTRNAEFGRPDGCGSVRSALGRVYAPGTGGRTTFGTRSISISLALDVRRRVLQWSKTAYAGSGPAHRSHRDGLRSAQAPFNWNPPRCGLRARLAECGSRRCDGRLVLRSRTTGTRWNTSLWRCSKGTYEPSLRSSGFDPDNDVGFPCPGRRAIVFWQNRGHITREALVIALH